MKLYIAAPWLDKALAIAAGEEFQRAGFIITSRWFYHEGDPNDPAGNTVPLDEIREQAHQDIADVLAADYVIVLNLRKSEGKAVETGIAIANGIPVISVGATRSNIFQALGTEVLDVKSAIGVLLSPKYPG